MRVKLAVRRAVPSLQGGPAASDAVRGALRAAELQGRPHHGDRRGSLNQVIGEPDEACLKGFRV